MVSIIFKDNRPDLNQMVVGIILDDYGQPVCCEMWPGNTIDDRGKTLIIRSECLGTCGKIFQAVGVAIPSTIREAV